MLALVAVFALSCVGYAENDQELSFAVQAGVWETEFVRNNAALNGLIDNQRDKTYISFKKNPAKERGSLELITYPTYYYAYDLASGDALSHNTPAIKQAFVYLPANYDPSRQYNILYLYHGGGDSEYSWFKNIDHSNVADDQIGSGYAINILDNLIESGVIEPLIVVTPSFYMNGDNEKLLDELDLTHTDVAYLDLMDLMRVVEKTYSTYAEDTTDAGLIASRDHRAMAGLSMGCCTTWRSGVGHLIDRISWFGLMSGGPDPTSTEKATDVISEQIIPAIERDYQNGYRLNMLLNFNGTKDQYLEGHIASHRLLMDYMNQSDALKVGENYDFIVGNVGHTFTGWNMFLYDLLQVFFV